MCRPSCALGWACTPSGVTQSGSKTVSANHPSAACNALGASDGVIHSSISLEAACLRAAANRKLSSAPASPAPRVEAGESPINRYQCFQPAATLRAQCLRPRNRPAQTTIHTTPSNHKSTATRRPRQPHGGDFEMHHSTRTAAIPQLKGATPNEFKPGVRLTAALPPPPQPTTTNARARKHTGTDPGLHRPASRVALASNCRSHRRSGQSTTPDGASGTPAVRRTGLPSRVPAVGFEPTRSCLQWILSPPP